MQRIILFFFVILAALGGWFYVFKYNKDLALYQQVPEIKLPQVFPTPTSAPGAIPTVKTLESDYHVFQTFNNCGPASLSMTLSYYGINVSQKELGDDLRPWQIPSGDNDDKSVTLAELAEKSKEYGFIPYHRPNGTIDTIKQFISNDMPVITKTWTKPNEDIGHFRVVKGYDSDRGVLIQDDSLQGKNIKFTYDDFNVLWKKFNYEYLVLVPKEKQQIAEAILGEDDDPKVAWKKAAENSRNQLSADPNDVTARFNLSVALYNMGDNEGTVKEFEQVEDKLSFRTLWYQIEPILAYYELENYDRVFFLTDKVLNNGNRAFSELYLVRGRIYVKQGNIDAAKAEFEKAVYYNINLKEAQEALDSLS